MRFLSLVLFMAGCPDAVSTDPGKDSGNDDFDQDGDGYIGEDDCDEGDGTVNVGAPELCDGVDNDCDGSTDEEATDMGTFYADADNDGHGDASSPIEACDQPSGYVESGDDCDDTDAAYNPGADESDCTDPNDYNCDGSVAYADADADGSPACEDCDDRDATRSPLLTETCNDTDDDCDGEVDEDAADARTWYLDADQDGYGAETTLLACDRPDGHAEYNGDCDDTSSRYHPGAEEVDCTDPNDYNCDGSSGFADADSDGFAACRECDDSEASIYPGATEYCDGADNNCDGDIDESTAVDASTWYADADLDGYGAVAVAAVACDAPLNYVSDSTDCDDTDVETYPGAPEYCDGEDDNCDGTVDEDSAL
ncbi:MAG: putative metal-binding motif-containing protein, partial [Deltaproteobacteria bacterium]|nr:putative metal-binding motif-containing protein [Deltaproteobacteria bacterium]